MTKSREQSVKDAAEARSDLNIFYAVIALLEGGTIASPKHYDTVQRIITLCKDEAQMCLLDYDKAVAKACKE